MTVNAYFEYGLVTRYIYITPDHIFMSKHTPSDLQKVRTIILFQFVNKNVCVIIDSPNKTQIIIL